ncbi:hypothetical protein DPX16_23775 [Anabarilius grahami]|uniref:Uncharacterized protein n=1 Tax=Anabarilius grahami TaxID=495550 RepID=A0A3N0XX56_ANAGA|nr:hypothetical protein DPX16_23775 [Anabarilius grahami]
MGGGLDHHTGTCWRSLLCRSTQGVSRCVRVHHSPNTTGEPAQIGPKTDNWVIFAVKTAVESLSSGSSEKLATLLKCRYTNAGRWNTLKRLVSFTLSLKAGEHQKVGSEAKDRVRLHLLPIYTT